MPWKEMPERRRTRAAAGERAGGGGGCARWRVDPRGTEWWRDGLAIESHVRLAMERGMGEGRGITGDGRGPAGGMRETSDDGNWPGFLHFYHYNE